MRVNEEGAETHIGFHLTLSPLPKRTSHPLLCAPILFRIPNPMLPHPVLARRFGLGRPIHAEHVYKALLLDAPRCCNEDPVALVIGNKRVSYSVSHDGLTTTRSFPTYFFPSQNIFKDGTFPRILGPKGCQESCKSVFHCHARLSHMLTFVLQQRRTTAYTAFTTEELTFIQQSYTHLTTHYSRARQSKKSCTTSTAIATPRNRSMKAKAR